MLTHDQIIEAEATADEMESAICNANQELERRKIIVYDEPPEYINHWLNTLAAIDLVLQLDAISQARKMIAFEIAEIKARH